MQKLNFKTANQLRDFYLEHGFFAIYDCTTEYGDVDIEHYSLLRSGEGFSPDCFAHNVIDLIEDKSLHILDLFLKTGTVKIHPNIFSIN